MQAADLSKPIDKKLYKGTNPSCHDFNQTTSTNEGAPLLVGFTTGQIQLIYPGRKEQGKLFNEEVNYYYYFYLFGYFNQNILINVDYLR